MDENGIFTYLDLPVWVPNGSGRAPGCQLSIPEGLRMAPRLEGAGSLF